MNRSGGHVRITARWGWSMVGICLGGLLLFALGLGQVGWAQSPPPDSQQMRPPGIDRIRQRIQEIRQTPTRWRQRLGTQLSSPVPSEPAPAQASQPEPLVLPDQRDSPTWADLHRVERRLQALIRELLADRYGGQLPPRIAERFRFVPPIRDTITISDTVRVATPIRDTVTVADTVRVPPDTVRETRIETVERRLLDTGVFRGFEVNFAFGESTLQPRATRTLDAVGAVLQRYPDLRLEIGGHTDAIGTDAFNQRLSEARAEAVRMYLIERFTIGADRLVARGYGESQPIALNEERSGRALNRRVEFRVLNPEAMP